MINLNFRGAVSMRQDPPQFIDPDLLTQIRAVSPTGRKPNSTQTALLAVASILEPLVSEHNKAVYDRMA